MPKTEGNPTRSTWGVGTALPTMDAMDLVFPKDDTASRLWSALEEYGFIVLTLAPPADGTCPSSSSARSLSRQRWEVVLQELEEAIASGELFGEGPTTAPDLVGPETQKYRNEQNRTLWALGYSDGNGSVVRDMYRVRAAAPDIQPWPRSAKNVRDRVLRGMDYCRHITDRALSLTLGRPFGARPVEQLGTAWPADPNELSVLHCLRYYNTDPEAASAEADATAQRSLSGEGTGQATFYNGADVGLNNNGQRVLLNVREHVDPGLFVLFPFLPHVEGLELRPTGQRQWLLMDGTKHNNDDGDDPPRSMLLLVGKAFCAKAKERGRNVQPTLHRVLAATTTRYSVVFDQKYRDMF